METLKLMLLCTCKISMLCFNALISVTILLLITQAVVFWCTKISLYNLAIKEAKKFIKKYEIF